MSDTATPAPSGFSPTKTATVTASVLGAYSLLSYGFDCQHAHQLLRPTLDQFSLWAATFAAPAHVICSIFMNWLNRLNKGTAQ